MVTWMGVESRNGKVRRRRRMRRTSVSWYEMLSVEENIRVMLELMRVTWGDGKRS